MIASVAGTVKAVRSGSVVVEVGGVGLLVNVPARLSAGVVVGTSISLHTVLVVREDAQGGLVLGNSYGPDLLDLSW